MSYSIFEDTMVDLKWPEVDEAIRDKSIVLLPTGVIEEHGPHMSLGVDIYMSCTLCRLVKGALSKLGTRSIIAPPFYWGINNVTGAFPGSFTARQETVSMALSDIMSCLARWGARYVFNINWHDDFQHCKVLSEAISTARIETGIRAYAVMPETLAQRLGYSGNEGHLAIYKMENPPEVPPQNPSQAQNRASGPDVHAGLGETSVMAAFHPDEVDAGMAVKLEPTSITPEEFRIWRQGWSDAKEVTPLGYLGNPAGYDAESGRQYVLGLSKIIAETIRKQIKPDPIGQD